MASCEKSSTAITFSPGTKSNLPYAFRLLLPEEPVEEELLLLPEELLWLPFPLSEELFFPLEFEEEFFSLSFEHCLQISGV